MTGTLFTGGWSALCYFEYSTYGIIIDYDRFVLLENKVFGSGVLFLFFFRFYLVIGSSF